MFRVGDRVQHLHIPELIGTVKETEDEYSYVEWDKYIYNEGNYKTFQLNRTIILLTNHNDILKDLCSK